MFQPEEDAYLRLTHTNGDYYSLKITSEDGCNFDPDEEGTLILFLKCSSPDECLKSCINNLTPFVDEYPIDKCDEENESLKGDNFFTLLVTDKNLMRTNKEITLNQVISEILEKYIHFTPKK